jgi:hypothetical protein
MKSSRDFREGMQRSRPVVRYDRLGIVGLDVETDAPTRYQRRDLNHHFWVLSATRAAVPLRQQH